MLPRGRENLSDFDLQELASLQAELNDDDGALESVNQLLRRGGGPYPKTELLKGRLLLANGDRNGLDHLLAAREADASLNDECLRRGYEFLCRMDGEEAADHWIAGVLGGVEESGG